MPAIDSANESANSVAVLEELLKSLSVSKNEAETRAAANNIASLLNGPTDEQVLPVK